MKIIDLHCDTLSLLEEDKNYSLYKNCGHVDLLRLKKANVMAQCFAIFLPQDNNNSCTANQNFKLLKKQYKKERKLKNLHDKKFYNRKNWGANY